MKIHIFKSIREKTLKVLKLENIKSHSKSIKTYKNNQTPQIVERKEEKLQTSKEGFGKGNQAEEDKFTQLGKRIEDHPEELLADFESDH